MELRDLIVTPVYFILLSLTAYLLRPYVTDRINRVYFLPALGLKLFCAVALGLVYQYYYHGGDTFNYHTQGSRLVWEAFMNSPVQGAKLIFGLHPSVLDAYQYARHITFLSDPSSYFVIRIAALFDLITFSTYSSTAMFFAVISFCGMWMLFLTFYRRFPHLHRWIACACLFIPSVVFWGSGLLKDTITLGCLGMITHAVSRIFIERKPSLGQFVVLFAAAAVVFVVKKYILLCFTPAALLWIYGRHFSKIKSAIARALLAPMVMVVVILSGYFAVLKIGEDDPRYSLQNLASTARITAYDIGFYTGKDAGSGYVLGELDGTFAGLVRLMPKAINVSLFRPYLWESNSLFMILTSLESLAFLLITIYVLLKARWLIFIILGNADILFCLLFSITFAFAVGVSTFNFGTLMRYKIPMQPFYLLAMILIADYSNRLRNLREVTSVE